MRRLLRSVAVLLLGCLAFVPNVSVASGPPPLPIACGEEPTCECLCTNSYSGWWTFWFYGCTCGGQVWNPVFCSQCESADEGAQCQTVQYSAYGNCYYEAGRCYSWGTCTYTG